MKAYSRTYRNMGKSLLAPKRNSMKESPFSSYGNEPLKVHHPSTPEDIDTCLNYSNMNLYDSDVKKIAT